MRENRTYGSEGGERLLFPTPIKRCRESPNIRMRIHGLWERSPDRDLR